MELIFLAAILLLLCVNLYFVLTKKEGNSSGETQAALTRFDQQLGQTDKQMKDEFQRNREENQGAFKSQREELTKSLTQFEERFENNSRRLNEILKER
ncbi:hypothetical protein N9E55_03645, partial [Flavobacteriaceae bacterium]|nr:hypothetical protein [Flavobacteriaceae bacterium]